MWNYISTFHSVPWHEKISFDGALFFTKIAGSTLPWWRACMWENSFEQIFYWRINAPPNLNGNQSQPPHFWWCWRSAGLRRCDHMTLSPHWVVLAAGVAASLPLSLSLFFSFAFQLHLRVFSSFAKIHCSKMWLIVIFGYRYWLSFAKETQHARTDKYKNNTKGYIYSSETVLMTTSAPLIWGWLGSSPLFWFAPTVKSLRFAPRK